MPSYRRGQEARRARSRHARRHGKGKSPILLHRASQIIRHVIEMENTLSSSYCIYFLLFSQDVHLKLKQRIAELDRHYAALLHTLLDVHKHAYTLTHDKSLSPDFLRGYVINLPRFLTERVPCLLFRATQILKDPVQTPAMGYFLYSLLNVLYATLSKEEDSRETVAVQCQEIIQFDLAPKDNLQRCVDSPVYFYRESAGVLKKLVKMLGSEAVSNAHLFGWTGS